MAVASGSGKGPSRPWIRLDCKFDHAEWLFEEHFGVRFAWECFLRYVKLNGVLRGSTPVVALKVLAYEFRIPEEHVQRLLDLALDNGAIEEDQGVWYVTSWDEYQTPEASRSKTRRLQALSPSDESDESDRSEPVATGRDRSKAVACRATATETATETATDSSPNGEDIYMLTDRVLRKVASILAWPQPKRSDVQRSLEPVQALVREFGEDGAAGLFVSAHRAWTHPPTWKSVFAQRHQLRELAELEAAAAAMEPVMRRIP